MSDNLHPDDGEITTTDVTSGYVAQLHHGDGTSTQFWGMTEAKAREKAEHERGETA